MPDYSEALALAIEVAREAGSILRNELDRAGGPRGEGDHAEADNIAEAHIRARLLEATNWGYLGEETGQVPPPDGETHIWLVDPNDGTKWYMKGYRGSAVSIGLLHDRVPVLGVVYAFAYPDDEGDLIAWAEGQPLTRNGLEMPRPSKGEHRPETGVILVSPKSDETPKATSRLVHPNKYTTVPSLAYRLALVAVGDGDAGVSITKRENGAVSWDFGAGHALLRSIGYEVVDEREKTVEYDEEGRSETRFTFGGNPKTVHNITWLDWDGLLGTKTEQEEMFAFVAPRRRDKIEPAFLDRIQGCLLGQFVGDSLGSLVEFQGPDTIRKRYPDGVRYLADGGTWNTLAGQPTDDSELALMLARTLVRTGEFDSLEVRQAYVHWYRSGPFDCGFTIGGALGGNRPNHSSQANGALMRISPLALFALRERGNSDFLQAAERARVDSRLTHPNPVCGEASACYVVATITALLGGSKEEILQAAIEEAERGGEESVLHALEQSRVGPPPDFISQQGWVLVALQNAFYQLGSSNTLEEALIETVSAGGDTDTNGAIAGPLLGAYHGRSSFPSQWIRSVLSCRPSKEAGARRTRPNEFWPIDVFALAEALALGDPEL